MAQVGQTPPVIDSDALAASFKTDGVHATPDGGSLKDIVSILKILKETENAGSGDRAKFAPFIKRSLKYWIIAADLLSKEPKDMSGKGREALFDLQNHPKIGKGIDAVGRLAVLLENRDNDNKLNDIFKDSGLDAQLNAARNSVFSSSE